MKKSNLFLRHVLYAMLILVMVFPFVQSYTHMIDEGILGGYSKELPEPHLSLAAWLSGEYQAEKEKKVNETFGFRATCIKNNNQIAFSFFKRTDVSEIVIGKDDYLYEGRYITSYYGRDFLCDRAILHRMQKLKFIQDTLTKLNKTLIFVLTPSKASFYPQYMPDQWKS